MKFYALVLLVVFLSVFELRSDAQNAESTTEGGKRSGKHKKNCSEGHGKTKRGGKNKTDSGTESLLLF
ncbi:hypothetical protein FQA39_LY18233 [Lamprigera yunnana]|nr:hypothetical protein FQA39_LY18233 [Lamprigera yunnana]